MRIVSYALYVPYRGIPHAGGEYYRRHIEALRTLGHHVTIVAPRRELNEEGLARSDDPSAVILVEPLGTRRDRAIDRAAALLIPQQLRPSISRAIRRAPEVAAAVASAELIEAHWAELAFAVRSAPTRVPTMLFAHDIPFQREVRWLRTAWERRAPRKVLWRMWRTGGAWLARPLSSNAADVLVVLSEKDALLARRAPRCGAAVTVDPPLWDQSLDVRATPGSDHRASGDRPRTALFVAAFNRGENVEAAIWLLDAVWPRVVAGFPEARLVIAGAHPPSAVLEAAAAFPDVRVTGYVEDLEAVYAAADLVVVPLRAGAGVKFKTIDALLRGLPVVSTSVGAEGIVDDSGTAQFTVADAPHAFADAVLDALAGGAPADPDVLRWARGKYGFAAYTRRLDDLIAQALEAAERRRGRVGDTARRR